MLFCDEEGFPITEYLPEDHEGREMYPGRTDPMPDKGRALGRLEERDGRKIEKKKVGRGGLMGDQGTQSCC